MERYLSTKTVGEYMGRSTKTVIRWIRDGSLRAAPKRPGAPYQISETAFIIFQHRYDPQLDSRRGGVEGRMVASQGKARRALILDTEPKESCLEEK